MNEFRRFIIGMAEMVQLVGLIAATIGGALIGMSLGILLAATAGGSNTGGGAFLGFILGGAVAFTLAATAAAAFFMLAETAANTRKMVELFHEQPARPRQLPETRRSTSSHTDTMPLIDPSVISETPRSTSSRTHTTAAPPDDRTGPPGFDLSAEAQAVVEKAKEGGYDVYWQADGTLVFFKNGSKSYCRNNASVLRVQRFEPDLR